MSLVQSISHGEDFRTAIMYRFFLKPKDCKVLCPAVRMRNKWVKSVVSYGPCIIHEPGLQRAPHKDIFFDVVPL